LSQLVGLITIHAMARRHSEPKNATCSFPSAKRVSQARVLQAEPGTLLSDSKPRIADKTL